MNQKIKQAVCAAAVLAALATAAPEAVKAAEWNEYYFCQQETESTTIEGTAAFYLEEGTWLTALPDYLERPFAALRPKTRAILETEEAELTLFSAGNTRAGKLAYANVQNYVNIRTKPSAASKQVGKLYAGSVAEVLLDEGEWVLVSSGAVTGYIKAEFLLFGKQAKQALKEGGRLMATVTCNVLNVRAGEGTSYSVVTKLTQGTVCEVLSEGSEWLKVWVNGKVGYVAKEYTKLSRELTYAVSMEEDALRSVAETEADERTAKERAAIEAAEREKAAKEQAEREEARKAALGQQIADYAVQFVGNPYVWGGTSLTNGADCSGFVYAVYKQFGYTLVRSSREQAACASYRSVTPNTSNLRAGDLVFYATGGVVDHVALYIGNGKVVQASTPREGIIISRYNYRTPYSAKRIIY